MHAPPRCAPRAMRFDRKSRLVLLARVESLRRATECWRGLNDRAGRCFGYRTLCEALTDIQPRCD